MSNPRDRRLADQMTGDLTLLDDLSLDFSLPSSSEALEELYNAFTNNDHDSNPFSSSLSIEEDPFLLNIETPSRKRKHNTSESLETISKKAHPRSQINSVHRKINQAKLHIIQQANIDMQETTKNFKKFSVKELSKHDAIYREYQTTDKILNYFNNIPLTQKEHATSFYYYLKSKNFFDKLTPDNAALTFQSLSNLPRDLVVDFYSCYAYLIFQASTENLNIVINNIIIKKGYSFVFTCTFVVDLLQLHETNEQHLSFRTKISQYNNATPTKTFISELLKLPQLSADYDNITGNISMYIKLYKLRLQLITQPKKKFSKSELLSHVNILGALQETHDILFFANVAFSPSYNQPALAYLLMENIATRSLIQLHDLIYQQQLQKIINKYKNTEFAISKTPQVEFSLDENVFTPPFYAQTSSTQDVLEFLNLNEFKEDAEPTVLTPQPAVVLTNVADNHNQLPSASAKDWMRKAFLSIIKTVNERHHQHYIKEYQSKSLTKDAIALISKLPDQIKTNEELTQHFITLAKAKTPGISSYYYYLATRNLFSEASNNELACIFNGLLSAYKETAIQFYSCYSHKIIDASPDILTNTIRRLFKTSCPHAFVSNFIIDLLIANQATKFKAIIIAEVNRFKSHWKDTSLLNLIINENGFRMLDQENYSSVLKLYEFRMLFAHYPTCDLTNLQSLECTELLAKFGSPEEVFFFADIATRSQSKFAYHLLKVNKISIQLKNTSLYEKLYSKALKQEENLVGSSLKKPFVAVEITQATPVGLGFFNQATSTTSNSIYQALEANQAFTHS